MSESFQKLLEARRERSAGEARTQRLLLIGGAIVFILVVAFLIWRGRPRSGGVDAGAWSVIIIARLRGLSRSP